MDLKGCRNEKGLSQGQVQLELCVKGYVKNSYRMDPAAVCPLVMGKKQDCQILSHPKEGKACLQVSSREGAAVISDHGVRVDKLERQAK